MAFPDKGPELDLSTIRPIQMKKPVRHSKSMYRSICMPSETQTYSLCIAYMRQWFLEKFNPNTFKTIYLNDKHVFDEVRTSSPLQIIKRDRPALAITPAINWDFDNDGLDIYQYGLDTYSQMGLYKRSFMKDPSHSVYLGIGMKTVMMEFQYRMIVDTRAEQLDIYNTIKMAHRLRTSDGDDLDLDFHVPYPIMLQIAKDCGFKIVPSSDPNDYPKICDIPKFLRYLNMYSEIPFMYKHRTLNGKFEFFIRMQHVHAHIKPTGLNADDGDTTGHLKTRYGIEFTAEVRFPAPKMYAYYSENEHNLHKLYSPGEASDGRVTSIYTFKETPIPDVNHYGWPLYLHTTYEVEPEDLDKPLVLDFHELLEGDVLRAAHDTVAQAISPSIFIELLVINGSQKLTGKMDWENFTFTSNQPITVEGSFIGLYIDMAHVHNVSIHTDGMIDNRIERSKEEET